MHQEAMQAGSGGVSVALAALEKADIAGRQFTRVDGLGNVVIHAAFRAEFCIAGKGVCRAGDDRGRGGARR